MRIGINGSSLLVRPDLGQIVADAGATDFTAVVMGADADETAATRALLASL